MKNEKNRVFGNSEQPQFPDLIKAGLKVGDKVYSYLYGEGVVGIISEMGNRIVVQFAEHSTSFTATGFKAIDYGLIPTIHIQPWNPIAGEPFPFPKFEPIVGEVYAFWDNGDPFFFVSEFAGMRKVDNEDSNNYLQWDDFGFGIYPDDSKTIYKTCENCAPISEAMRIFGFDKVGGVEQ
jgi:hypothetical protein